jgi:hypothetical protein
MINDALRNASISYSYSVPYIHLDGAYYSIKTKNFSDEVKKKRVKKDEQDDDTASTISTPVVEKKIVAPTVVTVPATVPATVPVPVPTITPAVPVTPIAPIKRKKPVVAPTVEEELANELGEDAELQAVIAASLEK